MATAPIWYLLADGANARVIVLKYRNGRNRIDLIEEFGVESLPTSELVSDRQGRTHDRMGFHRHATEPRMDPHRYEKYRFARQIGDYLEHAESEGRFSSLVLIAPPQMLGDLRLTLPESVQRLVSEEVPKDFVGLPLTELDNRLKDIHVAH